MPFQSILFAGRLAALQVTFFLPNRKGHLFLPDHHPKKFSSRKGTGVEFGDRSKSFSTYDFFNSRLPGSLD